MIMFWLKEAIKTVGRAKSAFVLSFISITISVVLITASILLIYISQYFGKTIKENISINIFLEDEIAGNRVQDIERELKEREYIKEVNFVSKDEAADIFVKETGEDFRKLLDYNPLPASFTVTLKENYVDENAISMFITQLNSLEGVEEVTFRQDFVYKLLNYLDEIKNYIFGATVILLIISVYIVYSTIKLIISARYEEMETMKYVGAKLSSIKMPVILNGLFIGLLSGIFSLLIIVLIAQYLGVLVRIQNEAVFNKEILLGIILFTGPMLSLLISILTLRKVSLKV